jgi:hypothetical protein
VFVAVVVVVIVALLARAARDLLASLLGAMEGGQVIANAAVVAILAFGVFAALDQLKIVPRIVTWLWYALLATVVLTTVVAVGGGGIQTMQRYWERAAGRVEARATASRPRRTPPAGTPDAPKWPTSRPARTPRPSSHASAPPAAAADRRADARRRRTLPGDQPARRHDRDDGGGNAEHPSTRAM